jgi:hypothetical protein
MPETAIKPQKKATKAAKPAQTGGSTSAAQKPVQAPKKPAIGRPTKYDDNLASEICVRLSNGEPLRQICMDDTMPAQSTVYLWLTRHPLFSEMYTRAREDQADTLADEIQAIADEMPMETTDKDGNTRFDSAYINWMRLRIDSRKWVAAKLKPRKYGDRVAVEGTEDGPAIKTEDANSSRLFELIRNMEMTKRAG